MSILKCNEITMKWNISRRIFPLKGGWGSLKALYVSQQIVVGVRNVLKYLIRTKRPLCTYLEALPFLAQQELIVAWYCKRQLFKSESELSGNVRLPFSGSLQFPSPPLAVESLSLQITIFPSRIHSYFLFKNCPEK